MPVKGLEERAVVQGNSVSGLANQPARQLGMVGVSAPRGGDVSQVGAVQRTIAEALKLGSDKLQTILDKRSDEEYIKGQLDAVQGVTVDELNKNGSTKDRIQGHAAIKAKTAYNEMLVDQMNKIPTEYAGLTSDQYKEVLAEQFANLRSNIDTSDEHSREMLSNMATEGFGQLMTEHLKYQDARITQDSTNALTNLVYTESKLGDPDKLQEIVDNFDVLMPGTTVEGREAALTAAITRSMNEGDLSVFNAVGGIDGMVKRNMSDAAISQVSSTLDAFNKTYKDEFDGAELLQNNFTGFTEYSGRAQQIAMSQAREKIASDVLMDPRFTDDNQRSKEIAKQHVEFLKKAPLVDKQIQAEFAAVGQAAPVDANGMLDREHTDALEYFNTMRANGMNERLIKAYTGASYDYLSIASDFAQTSADPKVALGAAWEQSRPNAKVNPRVTDDQVDAYWNDKNGFFTATGVFGAAGRLITDSNKNKFFNSIEPSVWDAVMGGNSNGKYYEVLTNQVKEAAENSTALDSWIHTQAKRYAKIYPDMSIEATMKLVQRDVGKWEYVMGTLVPPRDGATMTDILGLDDFGEGTLKSNSAMLTYIKDHKDELFPAGGSTRDVYDNIDKSISDALDALSIAAVSVDSKGVRVGAAKATDVNPMMFSENWQRLTNDISTIDITPMSNGNVMITMYDSPKKTNMAGAPIMVPGRVIGDYYKQKTINNAKDKNLPRR